jgi:DEAD/DEAH box helicase domain-containing protein
LVHALNTAFAFLLKAGRAGRGKDRLETPSVSVVVCFNSPSEQQIWRRPKSLLSKGLSASDTIPIRSDLVQGHLLCASAEFPLTGSYAVARIAGCEHAAEQNLTSDRDLFGANEYDEALAALRLTGSVNEELIPDPVDSTSTLAVFKARASLRKAWSRLSIRSIEPIHYSVVDLSHPGQRGRTDGIHDSAAVLDTLPYSRVFYHAHPGAIITHRARTYEIVTMTTPPAFVAENFSYRRSLNLAAFVKPKQAKYFTRPLSKTTITVVKQMEMVESREKIPVSSPPTSTHAAECETHLEAEERVAAFAGCGAVSVKRQIRGYKKLSVVNFSEIAKVELSLPPLEYDTFGLYICTDPSSLAGLLGERYGPGVHALSHALLAVAPLFAQGLTRGDLECDHSFFAPTKIILFDERAGGSGCVQRLWKSFFQVNNFLEAAISLLKECSSCRVDSRYDGGCPACLHASNCLKFNMHMSRSAAVVIGERMLERIKSTDFYKQNAAIGQDEPAKRKVDSLDTTPRRKARRRAMEQAKEMHSARQRQFVVGRPSWPLDGQGLRQEHG